MDLLALSAWITREGKRLAGSTVRKVARRRPLCWEFGLSGPAGPLFLYLSYLPPEPVTCLAAGRLPAGGDGACAVEPGLRQGFEGAVIQEVADHYPERRMEIVARPAIPRLTPGPLRLVADLKPPGSAFLIDGKGKIRWRHGEIVLQPEAPPAPPEEAPADRIRASLRGATPRDIATELPRKVFGIPPWLVRAALAGEAPDEPLDERRAGEAAERLLSLVREFRAGGRGWAAVRTRPADPDSPLKVVGDPAGAEGIGEAAAAALRGTVAAADREGIRRRLAKTVKTELSAIERTRRAVKGEIPTDAEIAAWRAWGELLLAHYRSVPAGATFADLPSFIDPATTVRVPLDPARTPKDNAARCFARAKKGERAAKEKARRIAELSALRAVVAALKEAVGNAADLDELKELEARVAEIRPAERKRPAGGAARIPVRVYALPAGEVVMVGRNARQNEMIYRFLSGGGDRWFHARDYPGSHVLLKAPGNAEPASDAVGTAEALAAWFSKGREAGRVEVISTLRRNLRKPPGSPDGTVLVKGEASVLVNLDDPEVKRMLHAAGVGRA